MDRAKHEPSGDQFWATDLRRMDPVSREHVRERLVCIGCNAPAYYVPPTKRGTCYFGARHEPECDESAGNTLQTTGAALPEADERGLKEDAFRLRPHRPRRSHLHATHDPTASPHQGSARRYIGGTRGRNSTPSVGLLSLLSKLSSDQSFATSSTRIDLPNGYDQVRRCCINVADVTAEHSGRQKVYWGTIHSAKSGKENAAWLQTQWGAPNILLKPELLELIMEENDVDELEEFAGASFIHFGYLNETYDGARTYLKPKSSEWFAVRLAAA